MTLPEQGGDPIKSEAELTLDQAIQSFKSWASFGDGIDELELKEVIERELVEAERNAVAWTIGVIDDLHIHTDSNLNADDDKIYKGIKNTIRKKYEFIKGIDPAPSYPVNAQLTNQEGEK